MYSTSSLARLSDCSLEVKCGPEVGVAPTKNFTSQIAVLYYVADTIGSNFTGIATDMALNFRRQSKKLCDFGNENCRSSKRGEECERYLHPGPVNTPTNMSGRCIKNQRTCLYSRGRNGSRRDETRASRLNRQKQCCGGSES